MLVHTQIFNCSPELIQAPSPAAEVQEQVDLRARVELCALVLLFQPSLAPSFFPVVPRIARRLRDCGVKISAAIWGPRRDYKMSKTGLGCWM